MSEGILKVCLLQQQLKLFKLELADLMEKYNMIIEASDEFMGYMRMWRRYPDTLWMLPWI